VRGARVRLKMFARLAGESIWGCRGALFLICPRRRLPRTAGRRTNVAVKTAPELLGSNGRCKVRGCHEVNPS
jgi:hypothetical protein